MNSNALGYSLKDAFRSLGRHFSMTFASVVIVSISLIVVGITLMFVLNGVVMVEAMEDQLEIHAFIRDEIKRGEALAVETRILTNPGIEEVTFITREEALASMRENFGDMDLSDALGDTNPLPDSYMIKARDPKNVPALAESIKAIPEVETVSYGEEWVGKLISTTTLIRNIGLGIISTMSLAALFLITITIRLTVFSRRDEIYIMKYIGATKGYIRLPFFVEGLIIGLLGGVVSIALIFFAYNAIISYISEMMPFLPLVSDIGVFVRVAGILLFIGMILGALGSLIAVRKHLKV